MSIDPKQIDPPCAHRGVLLNEVQCESCTGKVMAKVFACPIYERCTPFKNRIPLIRGCRICDDRRPITVA